MTASLILLGLGILILLAGAVIFLVDAFRTHVGWGLAVFFIPGAALFFLFLHWAAARRGFLIQLAGLPLAIGAVLLMPKDGIAEEDSAVAGQIRSPFAAVAALRKTVQDPETAGAPDPAAVQPEPVADSSLSQEILEERWDNNRRTFTELQTRFMSLEARRTTLKVSDPAAVREFNAEVAAYADNLRQAQLEKAELLKQSPPQ